jgi:hypothetical protein
VETDAGLTGAAVPPEFSKKKTVIDMMGRKGGATLDEIVAETGWARRTVRGFISGTVSKKPGYTVESTKSADGQRTYKIAKEAGAGTKSAKKPPRKVSLEWASFQVLRKTNASLSRKAGVDAKVSADQRGHGLGVSMEVYTISDRRQKREAVHKLESSVARKPQRELSA